MKIYPNALCPCGSGKKYKKCCMGKQTISPPLYIRQQLSSFNNEFIEASIRAFNDLCDSRIYNGCLGISAALYIIAKQYGYDAELCYGLCELYGIRFYHAWLEIDGLIIDLAIYGNVNFSPVFFGFPALKLPFIGTYESSQVKYGKYQFDHTWTHCKMFIENKTLLDYMDEDPNNTMWHCVCHYLNVAPSISMISNLRPYASTMIFNKSNTIHTTPPAQTTSATAKTTSSGDRRKSN